MEEIEPDWDQIYMDSGFKEATKLQPDGPTHELEWDQMDDCGAIFDYGDDHGDGLVMESRKNDHQFENLAIWKFQKPPPLHLMVKKFEKVLNNWPSIHKYPANLHTKPNHEHRSFPRNVSQNSPNSNKIKNREKSRVGSDIEPQPKILGRGMKKNQRNTELAQIGQKSLSDIKLPEDLSRFEDDDISTDIQNTLGPFLTNNSSFALSSGYESMLVANSEYASTSSIGDVAPRSKNKNFTPNLPQQSDNNEPVQSGTRQATNLNITYAPSIGKNKKNKNKKK